MHFAIWVYQAAPGLQDVEQKIRRDFLSTYVAELLIWPAVQTFNFAKVPVRHQLLFVNSASLIDATFLCWYVLALQDFPPSVLV